MTRLHEDELEVDAPLVRRLIARDASELSSLELREVEQSGSTNSLFRLGDDFAVRLPRRPGGGAAIESEARWSPLLARSVPVRIPTLRTVGGPGFGYPERWAISEWLPGRMPVRGGGDELAGDLAAVVRDLGATPVPDDALTATGLRSYRSGTLRGADPMFRSYLDQCRRLPGLDLDTARCAQVWDDAIACAGPPDRPPRWVHGDLLAENMLVDSTGRLAAVLDLGALSIGDPTVDLVIAWDLLDAPARDTFRTELGVDDRTWVHGRAWALLIGVITFPYYWSSMPARCRSRRELVRSVLDDAGPGA